MRPAGAPRARLRVAALALGVALACVARAQQSPSDRPLQPGGRVRESDLPLLFSPTQAPEADRFQQPFVALDPNRAWRLRRARDLRLGGLAASARDTLLALDRERPHQPQIVVELARTGLVLADWAGVTNRLRAERAARHDSLLGSPELMQAFERQARPHDAAEVVIETFVASPLTARWSQQQLLRLAPADAKNVTEALRAVAGKRPERADLARTLAFLLGRQGQAAAAARAVATADRPGEAVSRRQGFAEEALLTALPADSVAAVEALLDLAADPAFRAGVRTGAARRAAAAAPADRRGEVASRLTRALADLPAAQWPADLLLATAHDLRETGRTAEAGALLARGAALGLKVPEIELERCLGLLREGPPERVVAPLDSLARLWPPARFTLAEAQFYAGDLDSALANYQRVADDARSADVLPALDRAYLLEEHPGAPELRGLGTLAWARWRGDLPRARAIADSLWQSTATGSPYRAHAAMQAYEMRAEAGEWTAALAPLAAIADSLPDDRLAPLARQRAGEAWLKLGDDRRALAQFEECLARYPKAWNAAEVRRHVERLRRERRL